mmetsp:Transcript_160208/g.513995  ORF Transcript_160208/g.513995 Transcript_160208/m.513995 type:complete len:112 (-) Transcript_160208:284-619(-)
MAWTTKASDLTFPSTGVSTNEAHWWGEPMLAGRVRRHLSILLVMVMEENLSIAQPGSRFHTSLGRNNKDKMTMHCCRGGDLESNLSVGILLDMPKQAFKLERFAPPTRQIR